jgi:undecaprenyl pyrophosphate phosphatase UppP
MFYLFLIVSLAIVLESLPISSSGNIALLVFYLEKYHGIIFNKQLMGDLDYLVNLPIAIVLIFFFFTRWWLLLKTLPLSLSLIIKIIGLGFITELITVSFFVLFSFFKIPMGIISIGFAITSCLLYSLRFISRNKFSVYSWKKAALLGMVQGFALLPGISRFGSTYCAARWFGIRPQKAFDLSFLISFPINIAAGFLGLFKLYQYNMIDILSLPMLLIMLFSMLWGYCGLWLISYLIKADKIWIFSGYTLLLALISFFLWII